MQFSQPTWMQKGATIPRREAFERSGLQVFKQIFGNFALLSTCYNACLIMQTKFSILRSFECQFSHFSLSLSTIVC